MAGLPPEEAKRLAAAREKAKEDPTVRSLEEARNALDAQLERAVGAAREKMKSAGSPEERREAGKAMMEAMKDAMLQQNPDLGPLLEQLGPPPMRGPGGPAGPGME